MTTTTVPIVGAFKVNGSLASSGTVVLTAPDGVDASGTALPDESYTLTGGRIPSDSVVHVLNNPGTVISGPKMYTVAITLNGTELPTSSLIVKAGRNGVDLSLNYEKPVTGGGEGGVTDYNDLENLPELFSGDAADLVGTLSDARIPSAIARDSETAAALATAIQRSNHTGTQSADTLTDGTTNKAYTATEKTKLSGVASGATANDTDSNLKSRANHTGTQSADTIVNGSTNKVLTASEKTSLTALIAQPPLLLIDTAEDLPDGTAAGVIVVVKE